MTRATILVCAVSLLAYETQASLLRTRSSLQEISTDEGCDTDPPQVKMKDLDPFDCYVDKGEDYGGLVNMGESGRNCMNWIDQGKYKSTTKGIGGHNYCRNPEGSKEKPWCYTIDPQVKWEYCNVPECKDDELKERKAYKAPKGAKSKGAKDCKYEPPKGPGFKEKFSGRSCMSNRGKTWWLIDMEKVKAKDKKECFEKCQAKVGTEFFTFFKKPGKDDDGKNCGCYRECILVDKEETIGDPTSYEIL